MPSACAAQPRARADYLKLWCTSCYNTQVIPFRVRFEPGISLYEQVVYAAKRSEEHTSELQSPCNLVCRLLLEKKKKKRKAGTSSTQQPARKTRRTIRACGSFTSSIFTDRRCALRMQSTDMRHWLQGRRD